MSKQLHLAYKREMKSEVVAGVVRAAALHLAYKREMKIIRCLIQMNGILLHLAYKREMKSEVVAGVVRAAALHLAYKREMKMTNTSYHRGGFCCISRTSGK